MSELNPHFTFENFVVGPANRLASAAARRAAERPGVTYNPLLIYSPPGLGKTHILGAVTKHVERVSPDKAWEYQTAEEFLRALAMKSDMGGEDVVPARYRKLDILLLDDVHLFTAQADVQEWLVSTLDAFAGEGRQVILASDEPPAELEGLGEHLRTRFESGLLVDIGPPEYETRVAIIEKWLEVRLQILEPGVPDAIGRFPYRTVTELDEAVRWVLNLQEREERTLSPEEATALLESGLPEGSELHGSELGEFLDELADTVAEKVRAQEAPWRKLLRKAAEEGEALGFDGSRLRRMMLEDAPPEDPEQIVKRFKEAFQRLSEIRGELEAAGNPWPEAAYGILKDPARVDEAEALLTSAEERGRAFPEIPTGPTLKDLAAELPKLVVRSAEQLVSTDRPEYNPLYVWSPDGLAARALLHAAGRRGLADRDDASVALTSVADFAEELDSALSAGVAGAWRERWWLADLLLIDGAQDLEDADRAQEEIHLLLEAVQRRRARVMIAGDRPPLRISALDDRLRAQLESGPVVAIEVAGADLSGAVREALERAAAPSAAERAGEGGEAEEAGQPEEADRPEEAGRPVEAGETEELGVKPEVGLGVGASVAEEDREWIRSFRPAAVGSQEAPGLPVEGTGGPPQASAGTADDAQLSGPWVPSPEQVILDWPRVQERLVEVPD